MHMHTKTVNGRILSRSGSVSVNIFFVVVVVCIQLKGDNQKMVSERDGNASKSVCTTITLSGLRPDFSGYAEHYCETNPGILQFS